MEARRSRGVPCRDRVSSFYDDVSAVGEVGRVDDEAVFEGKGFVRRTHDGVTEMHYLLLTGNMGMYVRTSCPSAVEEVYDRKIVSQTAHWKDHCSALLVEVVGEHLTSAQRTGRRVRGGIDLAGD